ncbi:glucosaminidase domain-containing protein [Pseudomonadota bacterium]
MFISQRTIAVVAATGLVTGLAALTAAFGLHAPENLSQRINEAEAVLERARTEHAVTYDVPRTLAPLPDVDNPNARKALFVAKMLVLIAEENERTLSHRRIIEGAPQGSPAYNAIFVSYGLKPGASRSEALARVDIIPESLCLAQAAIESAWGTSRFARQGHAYFGERTYDPAVPGIAPQRAKGFKVKSFASPAHSVRSFMRTLNTHRAYRFLRNQRAVLRAQGVRPSGEDLAPHLSAYSEIGQNYVQRILITIRANSLGDFDGIEHVDH